MPSSLLHFLLYLQSLDYVIDTDSDDFKAVVEYSKTEIIVNEFGYLIDKVFYVYFDKG